MMAEGERCEWPGCKEVSVVGVNNRWLCLRHYREALKVVRITVDDIRKHVSDLHDKKGR